ncbi:DNA/RNA non-specific endonuclease [Coprobacter sp.]
MKKYSYLLLFFIFILTPGCEKDETTNELEKATLSVSPENLNFDENNPSNNQITIISNTSWNIDVSNPALKIDKSKGNAGESTVSVTDIPVGETYMLTVSTEKRNSTDQIISKSVAVTHQAPIFTSETVYYDNLDKTTWTGSGNPYIDQWDGYINATGTGAENIEYIGRTVSIRNNFQSTGYAGASRNNAFYFGGTDAYVTVNNIQLHPGQNTFQLSFGCCKYNGEFDISSNIKVYISGDGSTMKPLTYSRSTTNSWALATSLFSIQNTIPRKLSIMFVANDYNIRLDDIKLTTTNQFTEQILDFSSTNYPCTETPKIITGSSNYKYVTHFAETLVSKKWVRNYTACYDTRRHNPMWVAYPVHQCYHEKGFGRTNPDPWRPDPKFTTEQQSVIYPSDWSNWPWATNANKPTDPYYYWTPYNNKSFTKGHLLRSADRGGAESEMNIQTFYPTNISPEAYLYQEHWNKVEELLSDTWECSDTIYVVTGCYYGNDSYKSYDASSWNSHSNLSKECIIPTARYKVMLRTKSGSTGKPIAECSADEVMAIGFWFPQNLDNENPGTTPPLRDYIFSVSEIEQKIGGEFEFFPTAPAGVKNLVNTNDWPGLSN